jgi:ankyrin repeat protein
MLASKNGHLPLVLLLLQHAADKTLVNNLGETARQLAEAHPQIYAALA